MSNYIDGMATSSFNPQNTQAQQYNTQHGINNNSQCAFNYSARTEEDVTTYLTTDRNDSVDNTCKLLENRKVENQAGQRANALQTAKIKNIQLKNIYRALVLAIIALTVIAATVSPLFAIGIAVSISLIVALSIRSTIARNNIKHMGLQNVCIDILIHYLKNTNQASNVSLEKDTELLNYFNKAVKLSNAEKLFKEVDRYDFWVETDVFFNIRNTTPEKDLQRQCKLFLNYVFDNHDLINHLNTLGFNTKDLKETALDYIHNARIYDLSNTILGKEP